MAPTERALQIGARKIGHGEPCYVIAEVGINHNGDLAIAKRLVDAAVEAGADAVKFQKRTIDKVYTKEMLDSPRDSPWGKTQREQKEGLDPQRRAQVAGAASRLDAEVFHAA